MKAENGAHSGMPRSLMEALESLARTAHLRSPAEILGEKRGTPAPDWAPWWNRD